MFSYISLEERVPVKHPLRKLRGVVDALLASMSAEFEAVYSTGGRPSVPPEMLLKAFLVQILFSIRSERLLDEDRGWLGQDQTHRPGQTRGPSTDVLCRLQPGAHGQSEPVVGCASCVKPGLSAPKMGKRAAKRP